MKNTSKSNWSKGKKSKKSKKNKKVAKPVKILTAEDKIQKSLYSVELSDQELKIASKIVAEKFDDDENSWFVITEAVDTAYDLRRMKYGLKPISLTLGEHKVCHLPLHQPIQHIEEIQLPEPIALICEWQEDNKWFNKVLSIMKTVSQFRNTIRKHCGNDVDSVSSFSSAYVNNDEYANELFHSLFEIDDFIESKKIVTEFNSIHAQWSFVKVSNDKTVNDEISVPFIRNLRNRAINCVDINLKETHDNNQKGTRIISGNFHDNDSYISTMVTDFIIGAMPPEITAVTFIKTATVFKQCIYRGYRLRVLTNKPTYSDLNQCLDYIKNEYTKKFDIDYSKCIVGMSIPSKDHY